MHYYPLFLDITDKNCLVVGAGKVGRRKIVTLLKAGAAKIIVIDKHLKFEDFKQNFVAEYAIKAKVDYYQRDFDESDLSNVSLVFVATSQADQNGFIANLCKSKHIFCNIIEGSSRGDFIVPAHIECAELILAISTSGLSPALTKSLKTDLTQWLDSSYAPFLKLMKQIRIIAIQSIEDVDDRAKIFRTLVQNELREKLFTLLNQEKHTEFINLIQKNLPKAIFEEIIWENIF